MADRMIHASVYLGSRKVAYAESAQLTINGNGEQVITDESIFESDGKVTCSVEFTEAIPEAGEDAGAIDALLGQTDASIGYFAGGKIYKADGRFITGVLNTTMANGSLRGQFTFRGARPEAT